MHQLKVEDHPLDNHCRWCAPRKKLDGCSHNDQGFRGQSFDGRGNVCIGATEENGHALGHIKSLLITCSYNLCHPVSCEEAVSSKLILVRQKILHERREEDRNENKTQKWQYSKYRVHRKQ